MQMELLLVTKSDSIMLVHELIFLRNYRSKDPPTLKLLIAFLVYVGDTQHLSLSQCCGHTSGLDALHTVLCFYMFYW